MSAKRKYRSPNEYLKYLKGELSNEERHSIERDLQADPFEMEAMEGMEQIPAAELEEDLLAVHAGMHKRLKRRRRRAFYYAAASVASLLIVGTIFLNIYNINPKSAQETIPKDETFLHDDEIGQTEEPLMFEQSELDEEKSLIQADAPQPAAKRTPEIEAAPEEILDLEEDIVQEATIVVEEAEMEREEAGVQAQELNMMEDQAADKAAIQGDEAPVQKAMVPVQEADEPVVVEAQPKRAQKKDRTLTDMAQESRAQEAPSGYATKRVSGIVVSSEDMEPLPGASLVVKGTDSGMVADMDGRFSLVTDRQDEPTVIASYIGMETEEYQLEGDTENRVVMQPDVSSLDEVVVIGSDADKSAYATGAIQKIELEKEDSKYRGAEPEGGLEAYKMYIEEQIRFPAGDTISNREVVVLKFNVESDGSISQVRTLRSPGSSFTEEALRLLNEGPSWNPAINESGATADVVRMRIVFKR